MVMVGKIYWIPVMAEPAPPGFLIECTEISEATVAQDTISFSTEGGKVELTNNHCGSYTGGSVRGKRAAVIEAALYEGKKSYLLQGCWKEESEYYTWVARINKGL